MYMYISIVIISVFLLFQTSMYAGCWTIKTDNRSTHELHFTHIRIQFCRHSYIYIMATVRYNDSLTLTVYLYKC